MSDQSEITRRSKSEFSMAAESNFIGQENEDPIAPEENPT